MTPTAYACRSRGAALLATGVTKRFGDRAVLRDVSLEIAPGEIHALLGQNGSGKSTLIKVLSGYHAPDSGSVRIRGRELPFADPRASYAQGCRIVHQDLGLIDETPVVDNVLYSTGYAARLGTVRVGEARRRVRLALDALGLTDIDEQARVATLSPNQKTGVAIARALAVHEDYPPTLLVLDEPTATFPESEVESLHATVRRVAAEGVGVLYVTHRLDEVWQLCDRLTVLRDGVKVLSAPVSEITRNEVISLMVGTELDDTATVSHTLPVAAGAPALTVENLSSRMLQGVSFSVVPGEIVGIAGITGSGRESLLATTFGAEHADSGRLMVGTTRVPLGRPAAMVAAGAGFVPADRKRNGALMSMTAQANVMLSDVRTAWRWPTLRKSLETSEVEGWMEVLDVRPADGAGLVMSAFSGGNQQKLVLAKWLRRKPKVLLVDEPTQGVDIAARQTLHRALVEAAHNGAAVVIASTDADELVAICRRVLVMANGQISSEIQGERLTSAAVSSRALHDPDGRTDERVFA